MEMSEVEHIAYYRVSTERQGRSGLGLEAQRIAVREFLIGSQGKLVGEFTEIESGRRGDRPQLAAALSLCAKRAPSYVLVIAKLDRLARNVAFVSSLLESRVRFVAADMPEADRAFLQLAAVFGEWEARKISERTSAALRAAKARGALLGWADPERRNAQREASYQGVHALRERADLFAANTRPVIESIQRSGISTLTGIAEALNLRGIKTERAGRWYATTVRNILIRDVACPIDVAEGRSTLK
jgi:DNA invertase Pin-like site-specific DNA recombinase